MKKTSIITLAITILVSMALLVGCSSTVDSTSATKSTSVTAATSAAVDLSASSEVYKLDMSIGLPPIATMAKLMQTWIDKVEEQSNGRVEITFYTGGTLLSLPEQFRGVQSGVTDITWYAVGTDPGVLPLNEIGNLSFLGWKSAEQASKIYNDLLSPDTTYTKFRDEFVNLGVIPYGARTMPPAQIFTISKTIRVPADTKGMKLYAGGSMSEIISNIGGSPLEVNPDDWYTSLERGLIEGGCFHYATINALGISELLKYDTTFGDTGCYLEPNVYLFNAATWNSLPADIQNIFLDLEPWLYEQTRLADISDTEIALQVAKDQDHTFIELTQDEINQWEEVAKPTQEKYLTEKEAAGATSIREAYQQLQKMISEN